MNVILNTQSLQSDLTGIGRYTQNLLQGLRIHNIINQVVCIPNFKDCNNKIVKKNYFLSQFIKNIKCFPGTYSLFSDYKNRIFIKETRFLIQDKYIYHEPCYILNSYSGPKVCTIHDLSHIHYPEYHPRERVKHLRYNLPISINNADHIITGSDFIRSELINFFSIPPNKITRIYHGISKEFKVRDFFEIIITLRRYNLHNKSYLLYVGTLEPRKNLESLIQAFKQLPDQLRKNYPLVLVGRKGWKTGRLEKLTKKLINQEQLYFLGYVPESELPFLYSGAYGFIYLSVYEGFGLPLLEAMASGIPTLASDQSSMPEIVGDAAIIINPFDIDLITEKLNQLITDLTLRDMLKKLGPLQAVKFSWDSCIENTIAVYRKTLISLGIN